MRPEQLIGQPLSIVRFYAETLGLHFGAVRPHGKGKSGEFALHVSCPWRIDRGTAFVTGSGDRVVAADGSRLRSTHDDIFDNIFGVPSADGSRYVNSNPVVDLLQPTAGNLGLVFSDGLRITLFPISLTEEAWRLFKPGDLSSHACFPAELK